MGVIVFDVNMALLEPEEKQRIGSFSADLIETELPGVAELMFLPPFLRSLNTKVADALSRKLFSAYTAQLVEGDRVRDMAQWAIKHYLLAFSCREDLAEKKAAADALLAAAYPDTMAYLNYGYDSESETISRILAIINREEHQPHLDLLDAHSYVAYAQRTQDEFIAIQNLQVEDFQAKSDLVTLKESVRAMDGGLHTMFNLIKTIYALKSVAEQRSMDKIASFVNDGMAVARARETKRLAAKKKAAEAAAREAVAEVEEGVVTP